MKLWNTAFCWLLISSFASAGITSVATPIDFQRAQPAASQFATPMVPASVDGKYQLQLVGDRYAAVFTPEGAPVAVFDLTLSHLAWHEILLGGLGFGNLNLLAFIKLFKKAKKSGEANFEEADELPASEAGRALTPKERAKAMSQAKDLFKELRLTDRWAIEHGVPDNNDDGDGVPYRLGASFSLADLQFKNAGDKAMAMKPFAMLADVLYTAEIWTPERLDDLAREMEFRYDDQLPGYQVIWNQKVKREPALPGVVANFVNPWQNLVYKHNLRSIKTYGETAIYYLGVYGMIIDYVVSRICQNLEERLDYHENSLIGILEAAERFEYQANYPIKLVDSTIDALYLNHYTSSEDPMLTLGMGKRKRQLVKEEETRNKVLKYLGKKAKKRNLEFTEIVGGKFLVARTDTGPKKGEYRGIYGLTTKPLWPLKLVSYHVNPKTPAWKLIERYTWDLAGFAARVLIPNNLAFKIWKISVGIRLEPDQKDDFIRALMIHETQREGELAGLLTEAAGGRYTMPLSADELALSRKRLRQTYVNPWRLELNEEAGVIERNLKLLKERIESSNAAEYFVGERMVPLSP